MESDTGGEKWTTRTETRIIIKITNKAFLFVILITMLTALLVFAMYQFQGVDSDQEITYNKFLKMIDEKKVEKVEIKSDRILITAKKESGDKVNKGILHRPDE